MECPGLLRETEVVSPSLKRLSSRELGEAEVRPTAFDPPAPALLLPERDELSLLRMRIGFPSWVRLTASVVDVREDRQETSCAASDTFLGTARRQRGQRVVLEVALPW